MRASSCRPRANPPNSCCICSNRTPPSLRIRPNEPGVSKSSVRVEQHRGVEALETREHAPISVLHDAFRVLIGPRPEQHADDHIVLRPCGIFAQQLVGETRQALIHFVRESQAQCIVAVAGAHFGFFGDFENQARDEAGLVDQAQVAEELDFGLNVHPAGKKSIGLVAVNAATSLASNLNRRMRASNLASNSLSLSSEETTRAAVMSPEGAMVSSSTTLPCNAGLSRRARAYMASMAPLFLVNTRAISSALREALPLPPPRVAACPDAPRFGSFTCVV